MTEKTKKHLTQDSYSNKGHLRGYPGKREGWGLRTFQGDSPSSVMVPLLEPPLLLDCRWDEEEDTEDSAACPLGEGEPQSDPGLVFLDFVELFSASQVAPVGKESICMQCRGSRQT